MVETVLRPQPAVPDATVRDGDVSVVRVGPRTALILGIATVAGLVMFCWPLFVRVSPDATGHTSDAPFVFMLVLPILIAVVLASVSEGGMDSKALAMLG